MTAPLSPEKTGGLDAHWLKLIAIAGMLFDHIGIVFGGKMPLFAECLFYAPGGLTFPIMAYLMSEGYRHTSNVGRYMGRLLLFGLAAQPFYMWAFRMWPLGLPLLNIMFTLFLGLFVLWLNDRIKSRPLFYLAFIGISLQTATNFDWGLFGVPLVYLMHVGKGNKKRIIAPVVVLIVLMVGLSVFSVDGAGMLADHLPSIVFYAGSLAAIFLLMRYSGKRGRGMKYFFYAFYPAHLLILAVLRGVIFGDWMFMP